MTAQEDRELVLVVGVGRSGTSLLTGILGQLGFSVPQPEVTADDTNPRGFSEPRWVVDFHSRLLRARRMTVNDSRPAAFALSAETVGRDDIRAELRRWLKGEFARAALVVVKDPRTSWFLPLWDACTADLGVQTAFVTMLRHPTEVIASARQSYGDWQSEASRAAAWINVTLETELATRGRRRAFVRYEELLVDWRSTLRAAEARLELPLLSQASPAQEAAVDGFVDPTLHRNRTSWEDRDVPDRVRDLAEAVWSRVRTLPEEDGPTLHAQLDRDREAYGRLYAEAEAIAHSSIHAAKQSGRSAKARGRPGPPAAAPSLRVRLARRVPDRYRRRLRRALQRSR